MSQIGSMWPAGHNLTDLVHSVRGGRVLVIGTHFLLDGDDVGNDDDDNNKVGHTATVLLSSLL